MKLSPSHLKRYKEIARLFWNYGRYDLVHQLENQEDFKDVRSDTQEKAPPERLAEDLEAMGPTYIKLGQVLSGRPDLLPEPYLKALARLQDSVKPFSYGEVEEIVAAELGARISKAFARFDPTPIAAASLGQVHSAALRDGREVVVKVQRPDIAKQINEDFEVLEEIAVFLDRHTELGHRHRFAGIVDEFRLSIQQELNYEREAQNLVTLGRNLEEFELIDVPQPIADYCTRRVITMDYVQGRKITTLSPLARLDIAGGQLAEELFKAYLKQVLVDGLFHADPHPGNVFITDQGHIALLDLGMVGHTTPAMQEHLLKLLLAINEANSDHAVEIVTQISEKTASFNKIELQRRLSQILAMQRDQGLQSLNVGETLLQVTRDAANNGLHVPTELTLLGKTLLQLDQVGKILEPEFDPNASVRRNVSEIMTRRMRKQATQVNALSALLEMKDFVSGLPLRINRVMDAIGNSELEVKVKAVEANMVMAGLQKIANRITSGIVLAALIMGASILTQTKTDFEILGYPGLAMLCFIAAAAGGFWLVISIFIQDSESRKNTRPP